jgi:hypothetical protein
MTTTTTTTSTRTRATTATDEHALSLYSSRRQPLVSAKRTGRVRRAARPSLLWSGMKGAARAGLLCAPLTVISSHPSPLCRPPRLISPRSEHGQNRPAGGWPHPRRLTVEHPANAAAGRRPFSSCGVDLDSAPPARYRPASSRACHRWRLLGSRLADRRLGFALPSCQGGKYYPVKARAAVLALPAEPAVASSGPPPPPPVRLPPAADPKPLTSKT